MSHPSVQPPFQGGKKKKNSLIRIQFLSRCRRFMDCYETLNAAYNSSVLYPPCPFRKSAHLKCFYFIALFNLWPCPIWLSHWLPIHLFKHVKHLTPWLLIKHLRNYRFIFFLVNTIFLLYILFSLRITLFLIPYIYHLSLEPYIFFYQFASRSFE